MVNFNTKEYWENYYENHRVSKDSSTFAKFVINMLSPEKKLIDLGCGNARDTIFFSQHHIYSLGIDLAEKEIEFLKTEFKDNKYLDFHAFDLAELGDLGNFDYAYSRFSLHAIDEECESHLMQWIQKYLNKDGLFLLEVRSNKDNMLTKGEKISDNENITNHYRRYLDFETIKNKISAMNFEIIHAEESDGLSVVGDDDPVLIRIIAKKK